ncbi:aconitate hydratase AcnA [Alcaligenes endophyticus]|uniref:Aconitate hydratase n=1 Tax=Alcaligenes endophyticus TaxID=1929088 RepID=A0ABT8EIH6_9BURK|nr:aconitate hydratase AcnA [Alcaligenes endophyticus]MCX5592569.1 aconitate hydratase AcnA [Alcaligenes endophyticus]MDN4121083.1 aconitate hydratase AcnA [Alcaligenes endophyticus]
MTSHVALQDLQLGSRTVQYVPISQVPEIDTLPFSLRVLLENLYRQQALRDGDVSSEIESLLQRRVGDGITFYPARVFGQDILGLVMLLDMAAMREGVQNAGGNASLVRPHVPIDVIIDHSLQVDSWANPQAADINLAREYQRNGERFAFLRWCASAFDGVKVVPPGKGIMHQLHIENIGQVVWSKEDQDQTLVYPDSCVGTDSHTPMVNGLGILGWGVGGIEAEAVMVGLPVTIALPAVVGIELKGKLQDGVLPTDLVLVITQKLRELGVVGQFVEFFGESVDELSLGDRGMIANMAPEYGATAVFFPIDQAALNYMRTTGRSEEQIDLVEQYCKVQKLWRDEHTPAPTFDTVITLDLSTIKPCIAGPSNPEDYLPLDQASHDFPAHVEKISGKTYNPERAVPVKGTDIMLRDGDVVIAAITSCTNTANPANMMAAGLVAKKAAALGLRSKPWVKTSLVPGSQVTADVLQRAGLQDSLDILGFNIAGFGCTTCNGGSGPLPAEIVEAIESEKLIATAVLSGNRNFEGRIHANVRAAYLASPALVVAYALAGNLRVDLTQDALGTDPDGNPIYLKDIWPTTQEVNQAIEGAYDRQLFIDRYSELYDGGEPWDALARESDGNYPWEPDSTYIRKPPYFDGLRLTPAPITDLVGMRPLAILGDSITTDHISPSGSISLGTPAADFLQSKGVAQKDFNNYTTRRANHEIVKRATFANIRLRNKIVPGVEGGVTKLMPDGEVMRIFEAAQQYQERHVPLVVIAGKNYGCGSSRDSAAKGPALLGVKAVITEGFERIHRTNLVGMGVLPLQFKEGTNAETLGLDGSETLDILNLAQDVGVRSTVQCRITRADGSQLTVPLTVRLDTTEDVEYWRHGGILPRVWRNYMEQSNAI